VAQMPLAAPERGDYRPRAGAGVEGQGVRFFVPWALARVVGEWNFYKSESSPQVVLGEHFYMQEEHMERGMYYFIPRNDLTLNQCSPQDYVSGPLEDWIEGALRFDGASRFAVLTHDEMTRDMQYPVGIVDGRVTRTQGGSAAYSGARRKTLDMDTNNFLIEVVFKTDPGRTAGTLVAKTDGRSGYGLLIDRDGGIALSLAAGGSSAGISGPRVNDGRWHHVIAEVDRAAGTATLYVDGRPSVSGPIGLGRDASLANRADFFVGKGSAGYFAGAIDFLRVSRGTLEDAHTTINELYAWEFNGPFLEDFTGRKRQPGKTAAGAIDL